MAPSDRRAAVAAVVDPLRQCFASAAPLNELVPSVFIMGTVLPTVSRFIYRQGILFWPHLAARKRWAEGFRISDRSRSAWNFVAEGGGCDDCLQHRRIFLCYPRNVVFKFRLVRLAIIRRAGSQFCFFSPAPPVECWRVCRVIWVRAEVELYHLALS